MVPHRSARSQDISRTVKFENRTVDFEDLGFTYPLDVGARPAGLAGAYVAAGDDLHSLVYNPAGLARIKRIELSIGLQQERNSVENTFYGDAKKIDTRDGGIDGFGGAWPFPAYRGSFVVGFGAYRVYSGVFDLHYSGVNQKTETIDNFLLQQTGSVYSYTFGFGVDLSPALSGGLSVSVLDGTFAALRQLDFTYTDITPTTSVFVKEDTKADLTGVGGRIGIQFFFHPMVSGGVNFTTPTLMDLSGGGVSEKTVHEDNAPDEFLKEDIEIDDRYLLPYRIDVGLAFTPGRWLIAAEFGYCDWSEASINRKRFRHGGTLATIFREVVDYRFGAEYTLSFIPLRVRAGYAHRPYALDYLQADRIDENDLTKANVDEERDHIAFGLGYLFGTVLTADLSYSIGGGKRSTENLIDERKTQRFVLTAAYRF